MKLFIILITIAITGYILGHIDGKTTLLEIHNNRHQTKQNSNRNRFKNTCKRIGL